MELVDLEFIKRDITREMMYFVSSSQVLKPLLRKKENSATPWSYTAYIDPGLQASHFLTEMEEVKKRVESVLELSVFLLDYLKDLSLSQQKKLQKHDSSLILKA